MRQKTALRRLNVMMIVFACLAGIISAIWIVGWPRFVLSILFFFIALMCAIRLYRENPRSTAAHTVKMGSTVRLLDESGVAIYDWELDGKVSLLIGKSNTNQTAGIDLTQSAFAALVEDEHAILNFAAQNWYLEDISVQNGVSLEKDGSTYALRKGEPCVLSHGDIIHVAKVRLQFL